MKNPIYNHFKKLINRNKYVSLLVALILHLFIGIVLRDMQFYARVIWPMNMILLGVAGTGVVIEKGKWMHYIRTTLLILVFVLPLMIPFVEEKGVFMQILSLVYTLYFAFIFKEVISFLIKPSYINADIIIAAACGFLLLIEISVFFLQAMFYQNHDTFTHIDATSPATIFIDLVYYASITLTTIGYGDITPTTHYTKLIASFLGLVGQFYMVVLVGILISKFSSVNQQK